MANNGKVNDVKFILNKDGSIECKIYIHSGIITVYNEKRCIKLFKFARECNLGYREDIKDNAIIFENGREIIEYYKKLGKRNKLYKNTKRLMVVAGLSLGIISGISKAGNISGNNDGELVSDTGTVDDTINSTNEEDVIMVKSIALGNKDVFSDADDSVESVIESVIEKDGILEEIDNGTSNNGEEDLETSSEEEKNDEENNEDAVIDGMVDVVGDDSELVDEVDDSVNYVFSYSGEDLSLGGDITNAKNYEDVFKKYGEMYGIDYRLLMAIGAQESSGIHSQESVNGAALGLMQIEMSVWVGESVSAYNFGTGEIDTINITKDGLRDVDTNVRVATMILQNKLEEYDYNVPIAIQAYNFGSGNMNKVLSTCSSLEGISVSDLISNPSNDIWMNYRGVASGGDKNYVEHVLENLPDDVVLMITERDESVVYYQMDNVNVKGK